MNIELITIVLGVFLTVIVWGGIKVLPKEKWQMIAALPIKKDSDGNWASVNLTYYGAFTASSYVLAVTVFYFLAAARNISLLSVSIIIITLLAICIPASKLIALIVEKKKHTFSVGGASFAGIIAAPWIVILSNLLTFKWNGTSAEPVAILAAISIAYAFGEGFGRLACVSFGCCYGKPMDDAPVWLRKLLKSRGFIFFGSTKKVAYADNWEGVKLIPIQAITTIIYLSTGIVGFYMYLNGWTQSSLILTLSVTQFWRTASEFLRADYRGENKFSAYQVMSIVAIVYTYFAISVFPSSIHSIIYLEVGLQRLWSPLFILSMQLLWVGIFIYSGVSQVTRSVVHFHVVEDRV